MLNQFNFCGYVSKQPAISSTKTGNTMAKISVGIPRDYLNAKNVRKNDYVQLCAFGSVANFVKKWVKNGDLIAGTANLYNNNFTNKSGEKVYMNSFRVNLLWKLKDADDMKKKTTITSMEGEELPDFADIDIGELPDDMYCPFD